MSSITRTTIIIFLVLTGILLLVTCSRKTTKHKQAVGNDQPMASMVAPPVIVYKTKADYTQHVPIILSHDKKEVVSYPAPGDVFYRGELAYPLPLGNGYYLDRRGINEHAVFIALTYEAYSQLEQAPRPAELLDMILDMDPIQEIYQCGSSHQMEDLVEELTRRARDNDWQNCRKLK